jgi:GNAT superfamily N-acetyltransferase
MRRMYGRCNVITARKATADDIQVLSELLKENQTIESSYESLPMLDNQINNLLSLYFGNNGFASFGENRFAHIFEEDGNFVGACFHEHESQLTINVHLHIHKDFRGKGLAHKILELDASMCKGLVIVSMAPESNKKLIKAMLKAGYIAVGYVPNCWNWGGNIIGRVILFKE